jgi:predicted RNA-binding protein
MNPANHTLRETVTKGQIITSQLRSLDASNHSNRRIEFIKKLPKTQLGVAAQMVNFVFNFDSILGL